MFTSFSRTTLRVLQRNKSFAALNIAGLSIGITASLLIFLVIRNELSYDRFHKNASRIYRVVGTKTLLSNGEIAKYDIHLPGQAPYALQLDFPDLEAVGVISGIGPGQIYVPGTAPADEKRFKEHEGLAFVTPGLFKIFDFSWVAGNATGLKDPNTVVLTESMANTFFGSSEKAVGSIIQLWSYRKTYRVVGVFKDLPANTDIPLRIGFSNPTYINPPAFTDQNAWRYNDENLQCFVLAPSTQPIERLQAQLPFFVKKYYVPDQESLLSLPKLRFQPLSAMHLDKRFETSKNDGLSVKELWSLGLIGLFLLLVACINFINLATAQSVTRAKEIGVRKVLGSDARQIRKQFLYETGFITILAVALGCLLAFLALPWLGDLMQKDLSLQLINTPSVLVFLVLLTVSVTLLAGFYPAIVLSGFNPVMIFKNKMTVKIAGGISLRKGLVVFQFVIAQLLIVGTIVVVKQMQYFRGRPIGFEKDGIALISLPGDSSMKLKYPLLKNSLSQISGVLSTSICMGAPANADFWEWDAPVYFNNEASKRDFKMSYQMGDTGYFKTFGIKLVAGRFPFHNDSIYEIVLNETAVKKLGFNSPEEVIGKTLSNWGDIKHPIVGVVHDYNNRSLHSAIVPLAIGAEKKTYQWIAVRVDKNNMKSTFDQVRKAFTQIYPTFLYDQVFLDERIAQYYKSEAITAQLFKAFAFLAIFISCLGLYGLVSFMAVQKTKEVGIRKVLGASVQHIVYLFSKEFTVLIGIAFLIAAPVSYHFMQQWLSGFYYHINLGWGVFALAILSSVVVAWLTVGYRAIKAALINPVKSLKTE